MQKVKTILVTEQVMNDLTGLPMEETMAIAIPVPTIRTQYNAKFFPKQGEVNTSPSMTVPEQSMSVRELMQRHKQGLPLMGMKVPMYDGADGDGFPDLSKMDLVERQEFMEAQMEQYESIKKKMKEEDEARLKKRQEWNDKYEKILSWMQKLDEADSPEGAKKYLDSKIKKDE